MESDADVACFGDPNVRHRANLPIMVLAFRDNHYAAVDIKAGELFGVVGPAPDDRFVVVDVKGEQFLVFASDLKDRSEIVQDGKAGEAASPSPGRHSARRARA